MLSSSQVSSTVVFRGVPHRQQILLADANIPYKLSLDRKSNKLFFCINADEFSNQSFLSVVLNLNTNMATIIPNIRNGFASCVDQENSVIYIGGSDGIYRYDYSTRDVERPALVLGVDIFDMFFKNQLYYVDTANQKLHTFKNNEHHVITEMGNNFIQHFVIDGNGDILFVNSGGLYGLPKDGTSAVLYDDSDVNIRGATTDVNGLPYFIAEDGIFGVDPESKQLVKVLSIENGYGIAFDKDNRVIYSNERTIIKLIPCET